MVFIKPPRSAEVSGEKPSKLRCFGIRAEQKNAVPNGGKTELGRCFSAITAIFGSLLSVKTVVKLPQIPGETPFFVSLSPEGHPRLNIVNYNLADRDFRVFHLDWTDARYIPLWNFHP
jgi:hypothetical protein